MYKAKEYRGLFNVRIKPELHQRIAAEAINTYLSSKFKLNFELRYACYAGYIRAYGANDVSCTRCKKYNY